MQLARQKFLQLRKICFFPLVSHAPLHPRAKASGFSDVSDKPIGISEYQIADLLEEVRSSLPSIEAIEAELGG
jgi:hypothetical protein